MGYNYFMENLSQNINKFQEIVQNRLNVSIIMTPRNKLKTCKLSDRIGNLIKNNLENFSFLPVIDNLENIVGIFDIKNADITGNNSVKDFYEPINEKIIIGGNSNINEFIKNVKEEPIKLVISKNEISGLVTMSDMQKIPVRVSIFSLIIELEIMMSDLILKLYPNEESWMKLLTISRRDKLNEEELKVKKSDNFVSKIIFTQFGDKAKILEKSRVFSFTQKQLKRKFEDIRKLRDLVAHSSEFAETEEMCYSASRAVNFTLMLLTEITILDKKL